MRHTWSTFPCLAALLAVAPSSPLHGQAADAARSVTFRAAAGGALPLGGALDAYDPGWLVSGAVRIGEGRPVALQLEALHTRVAGDAFTTPGPADAPVRVEPRLSFTAVTAAAVLSPRRAAVRPYVVAGGGYYHYDFDDATDQMDIVLAPGPRGDALGITWGGGIETTFGRVAPYVEVRQHIVFEDADDMSFVPVTIGLRF